MGNSIGDSDITDANPTNIYVSAFFMETNLVTLHAWQSVYTYAASFNGYTFDDPGAGTAANQPVQTVNWYDCLKWCNARSQLGGLTPCYYTDVNLTQVYNNGDVAAVYVNWAANGYRLPTEAEWEKAARGGLSGFRFPWGNLISEKQANYKGNTNGYSYDLGPSGANPLSDAYPFTGTCPVASFDLNGYQLYDMAGNVAEWCWDWYGTPYGQPSPLNPTGAGSASNSRVLRGGNSDFDASFARCANRYSMSPLTAINFFGFRCVRGL
jgi:formylglycine-generating enzyme required for sulfatase activity